MRKRLYSTFGNRLADALTLREKELHRTVRGSYTRCRGVISIGTVCLQPMRAVVSRGCLTPGVAIDSSKRHRISMTSREGAASGGYTSAILTSLILSSTILYGALRCLVGFSQLVAFVPAAGIFLAALACE